MKSHLRGMLFVFLLICAPFLSVSTALASPGAFLYEWGKPWLLDDPGSLAVDGSGNVYLTQNNSVVVLDKSGTVLRSWGSYGSGNNQFASPIGIALAENRVYVWDSGNDRIQVFDSNGKFIRTLMSGGLFGPGGVATDATGNVYAIDSDNAKIKVFDSSGNLIRTFGSYGTGNDQFNNPKDLAVDGAGNIYVADTYRIKVFSSQGSYLRDWGPHGTDPVAFSRLAVDRSGNVYAAERADAMNASDKVQVFDSSGNFQREWGSFGYAQGEFSILHDIEVDAGGYVYTADDHRIQIFDASGDFVRKFGDTDADGQFYMPEAVALDGAGNLYVSDTDNHRIEVFDGRGNFLRKWGSFGSGEGEFDMPSGLAVDQTGYVYVGDIGTGSHVSESRIQVFDSGGKFVRSWPLPPGSQPPMPTGVAIDGGGNVYVADYRNNRLIMFDGSGSVIRSWGTFGTGNGQFWYPYGVAVDDIGNVYVVDSGSRRIQVFNSNGNFLRAWGSQGGDGQINSPTWIAVDGVGDVYLSDYNAYGVGTIHVFDSGGNFLANLGSYGTGPGRFKLPKGIAATGTGDILYVADPYNNKVLAYSGYGAQLPAGWSSADIGSVRLPGRAGYQNGVFTLEGAGENIWGSVDGFQFVYKPLSGDGQITARVSSLQNTNGYAKGGVMIRETLAANSAHAMMDLMASYGVEFSRRLTTGGSTTVSATAGLSAPTWVRLVRQGNSFSGYFSRDGATWTLAGTSSIGMANSVYVGLIVNSHNNSVLCTSSIDSVSVAGKTGAPLVTITAPADGTTYNAPATVTISADAAAGTGGFVKWVQFFAGSTLVGTATGAPFTVTWGNVPQGSYSLTAKVTDSLGGSATSSPVAVSVGSSGFPAPWISQDIGSVGVAGSASYLNGTFTVKASGSDIWGSADSFRFVYQPMNGDGQIVARVVSVQNTNTYAKAGVMIRQSLAANSVYAMMDLRPTGGAEFSRRPSAGGTTSANGVAGISAPYWVKLVRSGNLITASVSADGVAWLQAGSASIAMSSTVYAGLVVTSHNNGTLCTASFDGVSTNAGGDTFAPTVTAFAIPATSTSLTVPITTFTASDNVGVTGYLLTESASKPSATASGWTVSKPATYTFATTGSKTLYAWAKDAAGNVSESRSAMVSISGGALPTPWLTQDIGSVGPIGSASYLNGTFELKGSGADIYGTVDAFRFVYHVMTGDGEIVARVASLQNTNPYAKGGVMMRNSLAANGMHAMVDITPGHGVEFSQRTVTGGSTTPTATAGYAAPSWVRLVRSGNIFTGYVSPDGVNWRQLGSSTINMAGSIYVGLIVNSHNNTVLCTTTIDGVR